MAQRQFAKSHWSWVAFFAVALANIGLLSPASAQERDEGMHRGMGRDNGMGMGIGIGIGVLQELTRQRGVRSDDDRPPSKGRKTEAKKGGKNGDNAKKPEVAKKPEDKPPPKQPTDNPPPTQTTNNPSSPPPAQTPNNPPPTQTTNSPPPAQTPSTPNNPPPAQTTNNQPPADTNKTAHEHLSTCPQRGMGCAALIIDFRSRALEKSKLYKLAESLKSIACDVDYVTPKFTPLSEDENAKEDNNEQMRSIKRAIARHHAKVSSGKELAIEIVQGHGGGINEFPEGSFGVFGGHDLSSTTYGLTVRADRDHDAPHYSRAGMSRGLFHAGNYDAANKHVCQWFVWDGSCFSGDTPRAVDTLNNTGTAKYTSAPANVCPLHAAYNLDLAVGSSSDDKSCHMDFDVAKVDKLIAAIEKFDETRPVPEKDNTMEGLDAPYHTDKPAPNDYRPLHLDVVSRNDKGDEDRPSLYADGGYRNCNGPLRDGYKFTPDPNEHRDGE